MRRVILVLISFCLMSVVSNAQQSEKQKKADKNFLEKHPDGLYAKMETSRGNIFIELAYKQFPMTVANFVGLAEGTIKNSVKPEGTHYYDGTKFHRIIPDFMIQGGCPNGNGTGDPGYSFPDEFDANIELAKKGYVRGILAMANRGPNTNGSQFFIMHKEYNLPYAYSIFGRVVEGIEVVDSIIASPRNGGDVPNVDQTINRVVILRKGKEAVAFDANKTFVNEQANVLAKAEVKAKEAAEAEKIKIAELNVQAEKIISEKYSSAKATGSGLRVIRETPGDGVTIKKGDKIKVHCTGYLLSTGVKFWSSHDAPGQPMELTFEVSPRLVAGMEEGIKLLKEGDRAKLIIPYQLAYGAAGMPPTIPPYSWLLFEVEVVKVN